MWLTPRGYHLGVPGWRSRFSLQENWTWVKGAFHTVDRPYGRWLSLLGHPMTSHCKYVFKEIILSYIEIITRDYLVRKLKFSRLESLLSRKHLPLGTRITRKTSCALRLRPSLGLRPSQALLRLPLTRILRRFCK